MPLNPDDLFWLRLSLCPGVGARTAHRLLSSLGDIEHVFAAGERALVQAGLSRDAARWLSRTPDDTTAELLVRSRDWLAAERHHLLTWSHPCFPHPLLESGDAPLVLWANGDLACLERPALAIIGARQCTQGGAEDARRFAEALARAGVCIVSGLALGIDAAAHRGALDAGPDSAGTIAVVGTGLDRVYPARNKMLAHEIAAAGLILSEFPLGTPPLASNFPQRNRIISGLARGVLVVEAKLASGSLITARHAAEQGREVMAMPGSIHCLHHKGCHALIKQGAKLVESVADVLEELGLDAHGLRRVDAARAANEARARSQSDDGSLDAAADPLGDALAFDPVDLDTLVQRTGADSGEVLAALSLLEIEGRAEALPGGLWRRR